MSTRRSFRLVCLALLAAAAAARAFAAEPGPATPNPPPDARYKADVLLLVAHPDDEAVVAGYLARLSLDQHRRVAVLYGTRGGAGENDVGYEQARSLEAVREIEARRALARLGITDVWFLDAPDTPARDVHDVLRSLETWDHGKVLGEVVRILRLTRPAVVLTWLPEVVVGENHEDHQAMAVIATEAFDMAGDPTRFPEQVAFPEDRKAYGTLLEGLRPWQPQKLYYFSDASHAEFLEGQGPRYSMKDVSPSRGVPYARLAAEVAAVHMSQSDTGAVGRTAVETGDLSPFEAPLLLVLGKSLVGGSASGDVEEGVRPGPIPYVPVRGYRPPAGAGLSLTLGGPWHFYRDFWPAHDLDRLQRLLPEPEIGVGGGGRLPVPLLVTNDTDADVTVDLEARLPPGWSETRGPGRYRVRAHDVLPVTARLVAVSPRAAEWQEIRFDLESGAFPATSVRLRVHVGGVGP